MSDPVIERVKELQAKGFDMAKLPDDVKRYLEQTAQGVPEPTAEEPKVLQEQHPSISFADRFKIKNFGDDAMSSIAYLKEKNPTVEYDRSKDGQIIAKAPGEKDWRVLDPSSLDWQDVSDIATDVVGGVGQGAATAAAGLAGAAAGGIGALPAAMGTSALTGGAWEAARQKLGGYLGVHDPNVDWRSVGVTSAISGAAPLLLGTGATAAQAGKLIAGKGLINKKIGGEGLVRKLSERASQYIPEDLAVTSDKTALAKDVLENAQKGLLNKPFVKLGGYLSGIPEKILEKMHQAVTPAAAKFLDDAGYTFNKAKPLSNIEAGDIIQAQGVERAADTYINKVKTAVFEKRQEIGGEIENRLTELNKSFDLRGVSEALDDMVAKYKGFKNKTPEVEKTLAQAQDLKRKLFTTLKPVAIMDDTGNLVPVRDELGNIVKKRMVPTHASPQETMAIKNSISDFIDYSSKGGSDELGSVGAQMRQKLIDADKKLSSDIYNAIDGQDLKFKYHENEALSRDIMGKIANPDGALKTLKNLDNKTYAITRRKMEAFDKLHGTDLTDMTDVIQQWNYFADAQTSSAGGRGSEVNRRALKLGELMGGAVGGFMGGAAGGVTGAGAGAYIGKNVGGVAGQTMTSPAAMRGMGAVLAPTGKGIQTVINAATKATPVVNKMAVGAQKVPSAWMLMNKRGEK